MMPDTQRRAGSPTSWFDIFMTLLLTAFCLGGLFASFQIYRGVRRFVAESQVVRMPTTAGEPVAAVVIPTATPVVEVEGITPTPEPQGTRPAEPPPAESAPAPKLTRATNILIMGMDKRLDEEGPFRTDTMIVLHADPVSRRAAILSIPRDLLVTIPDYGYGRQLDRINTAHIYGEVNDYPGGGPALAKRTIEINFGIEVDNFIMVDFNGFRNFVDLIDGIDINVPEEITDRSYPTEDYGYQTVHFEEGLQHMDGERALIYARTRKSSSDFARADRQQQVILAVRKKVLSLDILPSLTPPNILRIARNFGDSVETDLTVDQIFTLANSVSEIPDGGIDRAVLDGNYVYDGEGYTLIGRWNDIHELVEELFGDHSRTASAPPTPSPRPAGAVIEIPTPNPTIPPEELAATPSPTVSEGEVVASEEWIEVRNGTSTRGLEEAAAIYLQSRGLSISGIGMAERSDYDQTVLVVYSEALPSSAETVARLFNVPPENVRRQPGYRSDVAMQVILGADATPVVETMTP